MALKLIKDASSKDWFILRGSKFSLAGHIYVQVLQGELAAGCLRECIQMLCLQEFQVRELVLVSVIGSSFWFVFLFGPSGMHCVLVQALMESEAIVRAHLMLMPIGDGNDSLLLCPSRSIALILWMWDDVFKHSYTILTWEQMSFSNVG